MPAGRARLDAWLAVANLLERSGDSEAAQAIHQGIALARSRLSHMPPQMRPALLGQSESPLDLIEILIGIGAPQAAVDLLLALKRSCDTSADLYFQLGSAYAVLGDGKRAVASFQAALARDPAHADAHLRLGYLLSERGAIGEGFEHFMTRARIVSGDNAPGKPGAPLHKVRHDQEQREYLSSLGVPPTESFHVGDGARIAGPVINPAHTEEAIIARWRQASPQFVILDDFLTQPALEKLRGYCLESTVWHRIYEAGYIGAIPADGFACPFLAQLAEEIASRWPRIVGPHAFKYLGAFKYDSELSTGTNTHADNSRINVNFYIAPDEANLDPQSGGMEIWDMAAPDMKTMRQLNGNEEMVRDLLKRSGAKRTVIPHRSNRAVIFKSTHFHKTDKFTFKSDYLSRRINISILFGQFGPED